MLASRTIVHLLSVILVACLMLAMAGCSDVITYANQSRAEGMSLYKEKAYSDAAGAFRNAIRQDPRDYQSQFWLGQCYDQMQLHQQAFAQYRAALDVVYNTEGGKHDPEFKAALRDGYAESLAKFDENDTELNLLERRAAEAKRAEEWWILAKAYRLRGDADSSIERYRKACHWNGSDFALRKEFGMYLLNPLRQNQDAEYQLALANRLYPADEEVVAALQQLGHAPTPTAGYGQGSVSVPRD